MMYAEGTMNIRLLWNECEQIIVHVGLHIHTLAYGMRLRRYNYKLWAYLSIVKRLRSVYKKLHMGA